MYRININKKWEEKLLNRFINYVKIYSTSDEKSETTPSTPQQWDIAHFLFEEMKQIGLQDVSIDENGYLYGFIPSNTEKKVANIGFIAHYDTSPDYNGKNVNPIIWKNYDGKDLLLNPETNFKISPDKFQALKQYKGQTIITADGTSLLGADDKAGIAEIMTAAEYLLKKTDIKHGKISICFNPDEEIGKGAHLFNTKKFAAEWAYTMDGGEIGELEYENFNAASATIEITGLSVHPGYAFGKMINANLLASELIHSFPENETPATTKGFDGFFHLMSIQADVTSAKLQYIIRDHDSDKFETRKKIMSQNVEILNQKYGEGTAKLEIKDQYFNMKRQFSGKMHIVDFAEQAIKDAGVTPKIRAIRGGTDGAQLSFMGLPCPNIFAGGHYFHGPYEFIPLESMKKATEVIIRISEKVVEKHQ